MKLPSADLTSRIPGASPSSYPVRWGNQVRPLVGPDAIFRRIGAAVEGASHSVWLTIAFCEEDFQFVDGRGSLFDVLDRAAGRGVDVRVLAWRPNRESAHHGRFLSGTPADHAFLRARCARFSVRWDRAADAFCQHQKSWMIDASRPSETAFVGGTNLSAKSLRHHDTYVEVRGPSASDVHHNFVQRWNEASERALADGNWACDSTDALPFPLVVSESHGTSVVQIQRMLHRGRYCNGHPAPGFGPFEVEGGEHSILEQYKLAIDNARRAIYVENQAVPVPEIASHLERALARGVDVVLLVPAVPEPYVYEARLNPLERARFDGLESLGRYSNFLLAGITRRQGNDRFPRYVHAKSMIVDDAWTTIGSCNLHALSLGGHSEMNASIWDDAVAREFRCALFAEHLGVDTSSLDCRSALNLYGQFAQENRKRIERHDPEWQGMAYALSTSTYATGPDLQRVT